VINNDNLLCQAAIYSIKAWRVKGGWPGAKGVLDFGSEGFGSYVMVMNAGRA